MTNREETIESAAVADLLQAVPVGVLTDARCMWPKFRLMAHEWIFGGYLLLTLSRLTMSRAATLNDLAIFSGLIVGICLAVVWHQARPTLGRLRVRLLAFFVAMNVAFMAMRSAVPAMVPEKMDPLLRSIDVFLIGETPSILLQNCVSPGLTELMSACYQIFFPYLFLATLAYALRSERVACSAFAGLFSLYGLGFVGYTFVPALGPYLAYAGDFSTALTGGPVTAYNAHLVGQFSTGVDVFPSLHVAVSAYLLLMDRRHSRWRFRILLVPCLGLWCSTFYLRYHYLIDMLIGFAIAGFGYWMARLEENRNDLCIEFQR